MNEYSLIFFSTTSGCDRGLLRFWHYNIDNVIPALMPPQLCLGTVQFGLPYGITNTFGQVSEAEVRSILSMAAEGGINWLDTAQAYGSAEEVVGRYAPKWAHYRLISKLPPNAPQETWEINFQASLQRLSTDRLDGFLLHNAADLHGPNGYNLLEWLEGLRRRGLVDRIGVSIYSSTELEGLPLDRLQLVQLPLSLYDQRLLRDGTLSFLHSMGIGIHVRSLFLQGLLLQPSVYWPEFLSSSFHIHHSKLQNYLHGRGLTFLEAAFTFARSCQSVEALLVGVLTSDQLKEILKAWNSSFLAEIGSLDRWAWDNPADLDPRCWPSR